MRLWSLQPVEVWDRLQASGELRVDPEHPDVTREFEVAYAWMRAQMAARIPGYGGGWPWWGWKQWSRTRTRIDLRIARHWYREPMVLLELKVPDEECLVSGYMVWHHPLNGWSLEWAEAESEAFDRRFGDGDPSDPVFREALERSWEAVFEVERLASHESEWLSDDVFQACFEVLRLRDVVSVHRFDGAGRKVP